MNGFHADPGLIERLATMLHGAADSLDDLGPSVPAIPAAGDVSGTMAELLAKQLDAAGDVAAGVGAAADGLAAGGTAYSETDRAARLTLPRVG